MHLKIIYIFAFVLIFAISASFPLREKPAAMSIKNKTANAQVNDAQKTEAAIKFPYPLPSTVGAPIWGEALDSTHKAIAGATIVAWPIPDYPGRDASDVDEARWFWSQADWKKRATISTTTAEDGSFKLSKLVAASYAVSCTLNSVGLFSRSGESVDPGTFVLFRDCKLPTEPFFIDLGSLATDTFNLSEAATRATRSIENSLFLDVKFPATSQEVVLKAGIMKINEKLPPSKSMFDRAALWIPVSNRTARLRTNLAAGSYMVGIMIGRELPIDIMKFERKSSEPDYHGFGWAEYTTVVRVAAKGKATAKLEVKSKP